MVAKVNFKLSTGTIINLTFDECKEVYDEISKFTIHPSMQYIPHQLYGPGLFNGYPYKPLIPDSILCVSKNE